jgi:hypothetical protein
MMMVRQFPQFTAPIFPSVIARPDRNVGSDQQVSVPGDGGRPGDSGGGGLCPLSDYCLFADQRRRWDHLNPVDSLGKFRRVRYNAGLIVLDSAAQTIEFPISAFGTTRPRRPTASGSAY